MPGPRPPRRAPALQNLLLLVGVGLALFALGELLVRWFVPAAVVGPTFSEHDPVYGKRLKRNLSARRTTPEFSFLLRTNSLGFRGPEPEGPIEGALLFIGDSYTMGYGVADDESFPARIEAMLRDSGRGDVPVVNAGVGNSGQGWWLPFLERRAGDFAPRAVVLQLADNDFGDNRAEGMFRLADGRLEPRPIPEPGWERRVQALVEAVPGLSYSHLVGALRVLAAGRGATGGEDRPGEAAAIEAEERELTRALVAEAIERCRSRGWPVVGLMIGMERERGVDILQVFDAWGVPWVRVPSKAEAPELYFEIDDHLNARGHAVAAERLRDALEPVLGGGAEIDSLP